MPRTILLLLIGMALAVLPLLGNAYLRFIGNEAAVYAILAISLNLVLGYTGLLVFVNAALFGIGAYAVTILRSRYGLPYGVSVPLAAILSMAAGVLIALPALRLEALYLALASVAFAQTAQWAMLHWDGLTGGPNGLRMAPVDYPFVASWDTGHYYVCLAIAAGVVVLTENVLRSRIGRALVAVRDSEAAAQSLAIDLVRTKTLAYALSALLAGLAGALYAPMLGLVVPESYDLFQVIIQFAMVVVGGLGSIAGSVIGAVLIVWMLEGLRAFKEVQEIAFGGMILLFVLFLPGGVASLLRRYLPGWREPLRRRVKA
jgi:branched-chain amino acid transport system permease protein